MPHVLLLSTVILISPSRYKVFGVRSAVSQQLLMNLDDYIEEAYKALKPEELFARSKEYSWQTFFHHSVSVALVSYRLGSLIKKNATGMNKLTIEGIEKQYGTYEILLFLSGLAHDYVKLIGASEKKSEERIKEILNALINNVFIFEVKDAETLLDKLIQTAIAVEGIYTTDLEETLINYVAKIVRIADTLMSKASIEEALSYIMNSRDFLDLTSSYNIKVAYLIVSTPTLLQANASKTIIDILIKHGWIPLVVYHNGIVLAGDTSSAHVPVREVIKVFKKEVSSAFKAEEKIKEVISRLERLSINRIYGKLVQTDASKLLVEEKTEAMTKELKKNRELQENLYHDIIAKYIKGTSLTELNREIMGIKEKAGIRGSIIDARRLATGIRKGSTYFDEVLSTIIVSGDDLAEYVSSIDDDRKKFLILAYMVVFASKNEQVTLEILRRALNINLPSTLDKELVRIIGIAEAFKAVKDDAIVKKIVKTCYEALGGTGNLDYYIKRYVLSRIKSNIINAEKLNTSSIIASATPNNYCRICGEPLLKVAIPMIQYAQAIGVRGGGVSEIWLHDDPPLANLEQIATTKETRIRYICPICYYEAIQLRERYRPPFFVLSLHPVVSYDLWEYIVEKMSALKEVYFKFRTGKDLYELSNAYKLIASQYNLKVTRDVLNILGLTGSERVIAIIDHLGARIYIPLEKDMSLKKKDVAYVLSIVPLALSIAGGGQVGLVATIGDAHNLGVEESPVVVPHHPPLLFAIARYFEEVKRRARHRDMSLNEYAIYDTSYIAILKTLYIYSLRIFSWADKWIKKVKKQGKKVKVNSILDYVLNMYEYINSIPYVPLALDSPPPERLDPREGDEALPNYKLISKLALEVESLMSQAQKILEKEETPSINKLLYRYAISLKELNSKLSKYKVQRPLRKAIDILLQYSLAVGEDAKGLAIDEFLRLVGFSAGVNLEEKKKKAKDQDGKEKEVSYRAVFFDIFDKLADIILRLRKELPPSQLRKLIEIALDSAYEKYKHA